MADPIFYTLNKMAELTLRPLDGGDHPDDSPYDFDFVIEELRLAMNEDLKVEILGRRGGDSDDKSPIAQCIYTYTDIDVTFDSKTNRVFAELPSYFLSLKYNKGIRSVSTNTGSLKPMIKCHNPGVTAHLPHASLEQENYLYYIEGMRVFWMRDIKKDGINKVMIKLMIAAPATIGPDDILPLMPENAARIMEVVRKRISVKAPQDRIADGNPNLRNTNEARK